MKTLVTLILIISCSFSVKSQIWPAEDALWSYCTSLGITHYAYTSDSLINDTIYNVVRPTTFNGNPYTYQQALESFDVLLFRQSSDTIFRRVFDDEYIYFINGLDVGDTFTTFRSSFQGSNVFSCDPNLELQVSEVFTETIEGEEYRVVTLEDINFFDIYGYEISETGFSGFIYIESIGLEFQFPYVNFLAIPGSLETGGCDQIIGEPYLSSLFAYEDIEKDITLSDCLLGTSLNRSNDVINIFPNPANRLIKIEGIQSAELGYQIFPLGGSVIQEGRLESNSIDISNLSAGLYFIKVFDVSGLISVQKVMVDQ